LETLLKVLLLSTLAGVVGMGLGGLIAACFKKFTPKTMCWLLSFAGGVMLSIVFFELLPESIEYGGFPAAIAGLVMGVIVVLILNLVLDRVTIKNGDNLDAHISKAGINHENKLVGNPRLLRSGIVMLLAIALHNLPEGMAVGAATVSNLHSGAILTIIIMIHCIPEGMAIAVPLIGGGISRGKAVALTALSGVPAVIGGVLGMLIGEMGDIPLALALAGAGGAMLYVVFAEILPQAAIISKSRFTAFAALIGAFVGLLLTMIPH